MFRFRKDKAVLAALMFLSTFLYSDNSLASNCIKMGCYSTYCVDRKMSKRLVFPCENKASNICYKRHGICVELENGTCGWYKTEEFSECMVEKGGLHMLPEKIRNYY